ncbi:MAG: hypothetical protein ACFFAU_01155 [Candidatus Hodarchaeota archaeon]
MNLQELVLKYKRKKDVKILTEIIQTLHPIIHKKAFELHRYLPRHDVKDLEQDLVILIMNMLNRYNSKRSKFITYLVVRFRGDPLKILQKQVSIKRGGSGYYRPGKGKKHSYEFETTGKETKILLDTLQDSKNYRDIINDVVIRKEVLTLLDTIEERKIFDFMYTYQMPVRVIAKRMKKSQKETSKIIRDIRKNPKIIQICNEIKYR